MKHGDKVRLTPAFWTRYPRKLKRYPGEVGTLIHIGKYIGSIQWEGRGSIDRYPLNYIEVVEVGERAHAGN